MKSHEIGKTGEDLAAKYLKSEKYRIIERNFRIGKFGEIDIIAEKIERKWLILAEKTIVFVEVKALAIGENSDFMPENHINRTKIERLGRLGMAYLSQNGLNLDIPWQIDVISIELNGAGELLKIRHHENVSL